MFAGPNNVISVVASAYLPGQPTSTHKLPTLNHSRFAGLSIVAGPLGFPKPNARHSDGLSPNKILPLTEFQPSNISAGPRCATLKTPASRFGIATMMLKKRMDCPRLGLESVVNGAHHACRS